MNKIYLKRWGVKFHSKNKLDGIRSFFVFENYFPVLFFTKREAMEYIKGRYGYLKDRKDLRQEPFGWRMPKPIKITIEISEDSI